MRQVLLAGEEAQEGAAFVGDLIANGPAEHGIAGFEGVEEGANCDGRSDSEGKGSDSADGTCVEPH